MANPKVYFTKEINPESLVMIYGAVGRELKGRVAVKLHSGEPGGNNYLKPEMAKDLVKKLNGTIVECNTAYKGKRFKSDDHQKVIEDHGFKAIAPTDLMDEEGEIILPYKKGKHIKENYVGSHFTNYDSYLILSHFKGHQMGGFGGALKNTSIGIASGAGKMWIHTAGATRDLKSFKVAYKTPQDDFLESMAEAAGSVIDKLGENILFINVMNNMSIDCDCNSNPAKPTMKDVGILASTDPVALDKACLDLVYKASDSKDLIKRIESLHGVHTVEYAESLGLGNTDYELIVIKN